MLTNTQKLELIEAVLAADGPGDNDKLESMLTAECGRTKALQAEVERMKRDSQLLMPLIALVRRIIFDSQYSEAGHIVRSSQIDLLKIHLREFDEKRSQP